MAIFAMRQMMRPSVDVLTLLDALKRAKYDVVVVQNCKITPEQTAIFKPLCSRLLARNGSGRDFGCYKDAFLALPPETYRRRLLLVNDSLFCFPEQIDAMISELTPDDSATVATNENYEFKYHLQSFAVSVAGTTAQSMEFRKFWSRYMPITTRRHAINAGEKKLTTLLRRESVPIRVLYTLSKLHNALNDCVDLDVLSLVNLVPTAYRQEFFRGLFPGGMSITTSNIGALKPTAISAACSIGLKGSQIHDAGLLLLCHLNAAIMKRDLFYRNVFTVHAIESALVRSELSHHVQRIGTELRQRGDRVGMGFFEKLKYDFGII